MVRHMLAALALGSAVLGGSVAASAQPYGPPPGQYAPPPPPVRETFTSPHHLRAFVTHFDHRFNMMVRVHESFIPVNLHQGTIINPTGLTLHRGMLVRVDGYYNGVGTFIADQITLVN